MDQIWPRSGNRWGHGFWATQLFPVPQTVKDAEVPFWPDFLATIIARNHGISTKILAKGNERLNYGDKTEHKLEGKFIPLPMIPNTHMLFAPICNILDDVEATWRGWEEQKAFPPQKGG